MQPTLLVRFAPILLVVFNTTLDLDFDLDLGRLPGSIISSSSFSAIINPVDERQIGAGVRFAGDKIPKDKLKKLSQNLKY